MIPALSGRTFESLTIGRLAMGLGPLPFLPLLAEDLPPMKGWLLRAAFLVGWSLVLSRFVRRPLAEGGTSEEAEFGVYIWGSMVAFAVATFMVVVLGELSSPLDAMAAGAHATDHVTATGSLLLLLPMLLVTAVAGVLVGLPQLALGAMFARIDRVGGVDAPERRLRLAGTWLALLGAIAAIFVPVREPALAMVVLGGTAIGYARWWRVQRAEWLARVRVGGIAGWRIEAWSAARARAGEGGVRVAPLEAGMRTPNADDALGHCLVRTAGADAYRANAETVALLP
jgi:hypothetical protein